MDQANFAQGRRDGTRIVPGAGLRVDFNELVPDPNTLGLWHLHNGGCLGEGTGLEDASGGGHPLVNHGADPLEDGYQFIRANNDYLITSLGSCAARNQCTLEAWMRNWQTPVNTIGYFLRQQGPNDYFEVVALRNTNPANSYIEVDYLNNGVWIAYANCKWTGAAVDALLGGAEPWHVAAVLDAPNTLKLFVNGIQRASYATGIVAMRAQTYSLLVNVDYPGAGATAVIDEVCLSQDSRSDFPSKRLLLSGTYASPAFDANRVGAAWKSLTSNQVVPSGTSVTWEVRAADELDALGDPLAEWQPYDGEPSSLPLGRWFQWRATLGSSADQLATPTVEGVAAQSSDVGYNLYHAMGPGPEVLDYSEPYARVGLNIRSAKTNSLTPGAVHWFGVRPVDGRDIVSPTAQGEVRIELDWQGGRVPDRPAGVLALSVRPLPGGIARLDWRWRPGQGGVVPRAFRIFGDGGLGAIDYQTPLGEVAYRDTQLQYAWESGELAGGLEHQLAVRAVAADEVWDEQPAVVRVTPDAEPPSRVDALQAEAIL
jgi:hypothetical protein